MSFYKSFPQARPRRMRQMPWIRSLVAEHQLTLHDLIQPIFVTESPTSDISALPGIQRHNINVLAEHVLKIKSLGIQAVALFPVVSTNLKDENGSEACHWDNLMCRAIKIIKKTTPDLGVIADVALDPYTSHGHDGIIDDHGRILNDATLEVLCQQSLVLAAAGADVVAPSDMMDGRVGRIRGALDTAGHTNTMMLAYSAKYASSFYGPFRSAVGSATSLGHADKKTYQQDFRNSDEAMQEIALDIQEGADWIMIKPGMPYLDVVYRARQTFQVPVSVYQVSGEYAMLCALAAQSNVPRMDLFYEALVAMKRAGASHILTYAAADMAAYLQAMP